MAFLTELFFIPTATEATAMVTKGYWLKASAIPFWFWLKLIIVIYLFIGVIFFFSFFIISIIIAYKKSYKIVDGNLKYSEPANQLETELDYLFEDFHIKFMSLVFIWPGIMVSEFGTLMEMININLSPSTFLAKLADKRDRKKNPERYI